MKITNVEAYWLRCPIPQPKQHRSDYGLLTNFDMTLIVITTDNGFKGFGEAKAAVGSSGVCASIVTCIEKELKPILLDQDPREINRLWEMMYNGVRDHYALQRGRTFPILGNRGTTIAALSGIDMALWDLLGKSLEIPVVQLLGGATTNVLPAYASGGWADEVGIGDQLQGYVDEGFKAIKMRVGVMDDLVYKSIARVEAARVSLGPDIKIMVDAHGTFNVPEAKQFSKAIEAYDIHWFEEPISPDNKSGTAEVRKFTSVPIAAGESEFTRFDMRELVDLRAVDVLQPDAAIIGGISEAMKVSALASTYQLDLAPHCWGSALSFQAGLSVAFASPSASIIEYSLGGNPMMHELVNEKIEAVDGMIKAPENPGLGLTLNWDFIHRHHQNI